MCERLIQDMERECYQESDFCGIIDWVFRDWVFDIRRKNVVDEKTGALSILDMRRRFLVA